MRQRHLVVPASLAPEDRRNRGAWRADGGHEVDPASTLRGTALRHGSVRYELLRAAGRRGHRATSTSRGPVGSGLERLVCVKRLAGWSSRSTRGALREEARLLASVRHANVVSLLAFARTTQDGPFLVLELVDGLDLRALCRGLRPDDRLADRVSVHVACALLRALAAVQRSLPGLVHRDVTPHNVLVSTRRRGEARRLRHRPGARPHALDAAALRQGQARLHGARADPRARSSTPRTRSLRRRRRPLRAARGRASVGSGPQVVREMKAVRRASRRVPLARDAARASTAASRPSSIASSSATRRAVREPRGRAARARRLRRGRARVAAPREPRRRPFARCPSPDIPCHGIDLTTRNEFHNGNAQKKGKRWIDHDLSSALGCKAVRGIVRRLSTR